MKLDSRIKDILYIADCFTTDSYGLRMYSEGRVWVMDVSLPPNMTARAWMEIEGAQVSSLRVTSTLMPLYPVLFVEICK